MKMTARIVQRPDFAKVMRNIDFGTATGLTKTAKQGQAAVVDSLKDTFTLRGRWFEQNMRHGTKITPARKDKLQAEVKTAADWLEPHETGSDKTPRGRNLAVPTEAVRRTKRMIIPRGQRPKGLAGKAFVLETKHGPVLAQRLVRGKRKGLIILYGLEPRVKIRKRSTFYTPVERTVSRHLKENIRNGIANALRTMR